MSFDRAVGEYEAWYRTPFGRYADNLEKKLVFRFLGIVMERGVLDVGCGTGNYSTALARQGVRVVGLDSSRGMLNFAKGKARRNKLDVDFVLGDAEHLPFKKGWTRTLHTGRRSVIGDLASSLGRRGLSPILLCQKSFSIQGGCGFLLSYKYG